MSRSESLKAYWSLVREQAKEQNISIAEARRLRSIAFPRKIRRALRIRKQYVIDLRRGSRRGVKGKKGSIGYISVRAITINPAINKEGLKIKAREILNSLNLNLHSFQYAVEGYSEQPITAQEDKRLNDYKVHVEILENKNRPVNFRI